MTLDDVKTMRTALTMDGKSKILEVVCDNGMNFRTISDWIIWDDAKERLVVFHIEEERHYRNEKPIALVTTEYEHIQYLKTNLEFKDLDEMFTFIEGAGTPVEDKDKIKKLFETYLCINDLARDPNEKKGYL